MNFSWTLYVLSESISIFPSDGVSGVDPSFSVNPDGVAESDCHRPALSRRKKSVGQDFSDRTSWVCSF